MPTKRKNERTRLSRANVKRSKKKQTEKGCENNLQNNENTSRNLLKKSSKVQKSLSLSNADKKLGDSFYDVPCEDLAKRLLGKVLVRQLIDGSVLKGRIVETECYPGGNDKASVTFNGRRTEKLEPLYMKPGTIYVYRTYGMYYCINISSQGDGSAVLLRAIEPLEGLDYMMEQRLSKRKSTVQLKLHELCNGPSKLCISFNIDENQCTRQDLTTWQCLWIEEDSESQNVNFSEIIESTRIGIDSVGKEWVSKLLRFYICGNESVSRRDKQREQCRNA